MMASSSEARRAVVARVDRALIHVVRATSLVYGIAGGLRLSLPLGSVAVIGLGYLLLRSVVKAVDGWKPWDIYMGALLLAEVTLVDQHAEPLWLVLPGLVVVQVATLFRMFGPSE